MIDIVLLNSKYQITFTNDLTYTNEKQLKRKYMVTNINV